MEPITASAPEREQRFRALYDAAYADLLRFVRRRVSPELSQDEVAEDVVAEVMLVAWRRFDDVPIALSDARAWLFGVARYTLQNSRRSEEKQSAVAVRLARARPDHEASGSLSEMVAHRLDVAAGWPRLSPAHQEAIALSVLDELSAPQAAEVLGISPTAFRLRLSRARRALRALVAGADAPDHASAHASAHAPARLRSTR